jgi:hypothetical protein
MVWLHYLAWFFGGAFLINAVPHLVSGVSGRAFQTPFATPRGKGLSPSMVNVGWGFANVVIGYLLVMQIGDFDLHIIAHVVALGLGVLAMAMYLAHIFGPLHGGSAPR